MSVHVAIVPETIFHIGNFPVTNSLLTGWVVILLLIVGSIVFSKRIKEVPGKIQAGVETVIEALLSFLETVSGDRKTAERFFPIVATLFLYILLSNWAGILPGVGSIGIKEIEEEGTKLVPIFRSAFSDLNMTLALALVAVLLSHFYGLTTVGFKEHVGKFFNFKGPVDFFAGILEIVGEISKIISELDKLAKKYKNLPMLARTHGQSASPTTFGNEMRVFVARLEKRLAG